MNAEDKSAYAKGYAAGRKKTEAEIARYDAHLAEKRRQYRVRYDAIFCAALSATIMSPNRWTMNGETVTKQAQYIALAKSITNEAMRAPPD